MTACRVFAAPHAGCAVPGRRRGPSSGIPSVRAACLRAGPPGCSRRGCRCGRCKRLSRSASLAIAPTMLPGCTPCTWPTSMRNVSMPTSGVDASRGARGFAASSPNNASPALALAAAGRGDVGGVNCARRDAAGAARYAGRSPPTRRRRSRGARSSRSKRGRSGGGAFSSNGVLPCTSLASAAAMSTAGTSCSRS